MTYKEMPHWFIASGVLIQSDPGNWRDLNVNFQTHKILADNTYTDVASFTEWHIGYLVDDKQLNLGHLFGEKLAEVLYDEAIRNNVMERSLREEVLQCHFMGTFVTARVV